MASLDWRGGGKSPSRKERLWIREFTVWSVNAGGAPGVWRVIDVVEHEMQKKVRMPEAICMQEVGLEPREREAVANKCAGLGYCGYWQKGNVAKG